MATEGRAKFALLSVATVTLADHLIASTGGTRYPNSTYDSWTGRVNVPPWPQTLVLDGKAFTANGWCLFLPNPA